MSVIIAKLVVLKLQIIYTLLWTVLFSKLVNYKTSFRFQQNISNGKSYRNRNVYLGL